MSRIAGVASAFPGHAYPQSEISDMIAPFIGGGAAGDSTKIAVMRRIHAASGVATRHLVMPIERYSDPATFTQTNDLFITSAVDLAERALCEALSKAQLVPADVDYIMFTSVTGISAPSIDALLVARLGLRTDVKRVPIYGLGCVAGAAGIARVDDYLVGHPGEVGALVAVELCSLTFQRDDDSMANIVATGLFGDGAAAVVMVGAEHPLAASSSGASVGVDVLATRSQLYPDTEGVIGFNASETGFRIVLTAQVADVVEQNFGADVAAFLAANGTTTADIDTFVAHPGGPRVLEAFHSSLGLDHNQIKNSWDSLASVGNLSSVSVLHILGDELSAQHPAGSKGLLFALGPGVSAELVLLRWPT